MKRSHDHTQLKRLAAISLVVVMCLSSLAVLAPPASAAHYPNQWDKFVPGYLSDEIFNRELLDIELVAMEMVGGVLYGITPDLMWTRSSDYGDTWHTVCDVSSFGASGTIHGMDYSFTWDAFFLSIGSGLWASYDHGVTWDQVMTFAHNGNAYRGAIGESPDGVLYIGQYGTPNGGWGEPYHAYVNRSYDGGRSWNVFTSVNCYHIHAVEVGHDGNVWIGFGDETKDPYRSGLYKVTPSGSVTNVSQLWRFQPTAIHRAETSTLFGTDDIFHPTIVRWDGEAYEPVLKNMGEAYTSWYVDDFIEVDGVIYAMVSLTQRPKSGNSIYASIDDGRSWYHVYYDPFSSSDPKPRLTNLAGEHGSPYIFEGYGSYEVYRFTNVRTDGIRDLMYGQQHLEIDVEYSTTVAISNGAYELPLGRNPIRDPLIEIYGYNLTSSTVSDRTENYPTYWQTGDGISVSKDSTSKTVGEYSLRIDGSGFGAAAASKRLMLRTTSQDTDPTMRTIISFDARRDVSSEYFEMMVHYSTYGGSGPPAGRFIPQSFYLDDEWRTYTVAVDGPNKDGDRTIDIIFMPNNMENQTCYIDNVKLFNVPAGWNIDFNPNAEWPYSTPQPVADVAVSISGIERQYDGPYGHMELIDTVQLTGDYYSHIPLSAHGDGLTVFRVTGERIGYAYSSIVTRTDDGIELRGGGATAHYRSYDGWVYGGGITEIRPGYTMTYRSDDASTSLTEVMLVSSSGPATISNVDVGRSTIKWEMSVDADSTMVYTIPGMTAGWEYTLVADGRAVTSAKAGADGVLVIEHEAMAGLYAMEIRPSSMTIAMDGMSAAIGIIVALAVIGGLFTMVGRLKF